MSVPIPTASLDWSDTGSLLRESCSLDRSGLANPPVVDSTTQRGLDRAVTSAAEVDSDAELLREFIASKPGEAAAQIALTRIVERHGSLVYQVALRLVNDRHLADDVFQATFLVLAQSARKIQRSGSLASWLHGTARNIGRRALARKFAERSGTDTGVEMVTAVEHDPFHEMMRSHERQLLDEELQQLPEIHRAPLVLFYLEERSQLEISQLLGITVPAVESRLKRAKQELRSRLVRRGITLSVALAAVGWGASVASAAPPAALVTSTISLAASGAAVGTSLTAGGSVALQLAGKELAAMSAASKVTALFVGAAGTLTVGGAVLLGAMTGGEPGAGQSPGSGTLSAVIGTETGLGGFEEPQPLLLAQVDEDQIPGEVESAEANDDPAQAGEEKEDAPGEADDEAKAPESDEKEDDAPVMEDEKAEADDDEKAPATEEKEDAPEPADEPKAAESEERDDDAAATPAEMEQPEDDDAADGNGNTGHRGPAVAAFRQLSAKDLKVYEALDKEITLEFPDQTLKEVVDFVVETTGVRVRVDEQALTDAGLDLETRVQFVGTHSLDDALSMLLENINGTKLDTYVERGVLHFTTAGKMGDLTRLRFYDLNGEGEDGNRIGNFAQAVEQFVTTIDGGEKRAHVISLGDGLAIQAPLSFHKQIEEFIAGALQLADARRAAGRPLPEVPPRAPTTTEPTYPAPHASGLGG